MKVLILSCNTGGGHNSCGRALMDACRERQIPCEMDDAFRFISPRLSRCISYSFDRVYRHTPKLFSAGYRYTENHPRVFRKKSAAYRFLTIGAKKLAQFIEEQGYDTVVCPHVFSGLLATEARDRYGLSIRTCFVATDYTCSPSCANSNLDIYYIPHEALAAEFAGCGIPAERIVGCGIPVRKDFLTREDRAFARRQLGLPESCRHLMVMCGSMGCGPIEELAELMADSLPEDCHVSIVCGNNRGLVEKLEEACGAQPRIHIYGFTDKVSLMMDSADLYLTKPGGISVTEAAHKQLPMVFVNAVAGCETHNMNFYLNRGAAVTADTTVALAETCLSLLREPERLAEMAQTMESLAEQRPCETILDQMAGIPAGNAGERSAV